MTTREIYFKALYYSEKPYGVMSYIYQDKKGKIKLDGFILVMLNRKEDTVLRGINRMLEAEKREGFLYWTISSEGEKFLDENWDSFSPSQIRGLYKHE